MIKPGDIVRFKYSYLHNTMQWSLRHMTGKVVKVFPESGLCEIEWEKGIITHRIEVMEKEFNDGNHL